MPSKRFTVTESSWLLVTFHQCQWRTASHQMEHFGLPTMHDSCTRQPWQTYMIGPVGIGVNAAGVRTPQCLTCRGPSMCWTPPIIPTQSPIRCTIFVNIIDFVVSAVVEQVYSSTFKLCLLKMQEICPPKRFIFTSKCTKKLTAFPQVP